VSRRRRAALLLGLALALGGLAASDVARRERALARRIGALADVLVAREPVGEGARLGLERLAVRRMPVRFAPPGALSAPGPVVGRQTRIALRAGAFVTPEVLREPAGEAAAGLLRRGERVAEIVAVGDPRLVVAGARVDVLVTHEREQGPGNTELALQDVEVVDVGRAPAEEGADDRTPAGARVAASLRVTLAQALYLTGAQNSAREIRLLPRAPGDRRRVAPSSTTPDEVRP
jgi:pilus assembly protein CpaB